MFVQCYSTFMYSCPVLLFNVYTCSVLFYPVYACPMLLYTCLHFSFDTLYLCKYLLWYLKPIYTCPLLLYTRFALVLRYSTYMCTHVVCYSTFMCACPVLLFTCVWLSCATLYFVHLQCPTLSLHMLVLCYSTPVFTFLWYCKPMYFTLCVSMSCDTQHLYRFVL